MLLLLLSTMSARRSRDCRGAQPFSPAVVVSSIDQSSPRTEILIPLSGPLQLVALLVHRSVVVAAAVVDAPSQMKDVHRHYVEVEEEEEALQSSRA